LHLSATEDGETGSSLSGNPALTQKPNQWLGQCLYSNAVYYTAALNGTPMTSWTPRLHWARLDQQINDAFEFCAQRTCVRRGQKSRQARPTAKTILGAVFEAIVNAVAHRD